MLDKLKQLIENEDPKKPYTDSELSSLLHTSRENITKYRLEERIPESRERRKKLLDFEIINLLTDNPKISERKLTESLNKLGFEIARSSVSKYKKEIESTISVPTLSKKEDENDPFCDLIGATGSLKTQINQAKASILYPPKGLHTLITGPSGSGKSFIAKKMYEYAMTTTNFSKDVPFEIFNCADYADNPQFLLSQLFGYVKGAFTGATEDKKGLVEICDGGILFLDEIHRLPPEGQEILFYLLDQNLYRRLGETELTRTSKLLLVGATTEDPTETLLLTFRRRIPIAIEMPSYHARSVSEKFQFIKIFFENESKRVNKPFKIKRDVIKSLLSYSCMGNIGQLKSDIQGASAKGFLNSAIDEKDTVLITFQELSKSIINEIIEKEHFNDDVFSFSMDDLFVDGRNSQNTVPPSVSVSTDTIYDYIEYTYRSMKQDGLSQEQISATLSEQIDNEMKRLSKAINNRKMNYEMLENIIGLKALSVTKKSFELANKHLKNLDSSLFFPLSIHLNSAINRFLSNKETINPNLDIIKQDYKDEFEVATLIKNLIDYEYDVNLAEDEIGFIALYLKNFRGFIQQESKKIGVVVLSHGHVAKGMAEVANKLLGVNHAIGLEMDLTDSPNLMLEKTIPVVKNANQGKGVLILADMGSLILFGDIITAQTNIPVRVIGRVDTLMVIESIRRSLLPEDTLDNIADEIDTKQFLTGSTFISPIKKKKVVVTLCLTGEGAAKVLKNYIETSIYNFPENIEVIPIGFFSKENTSSKLNKIAHSNEIVAIIGTVNPNYKTIPFISAEELFNNSNQLLSFLENSTSIQKENNLKHFLDKDLITIEQDFTMKNTVLDNMTTKLIERQKVTSEYTLSVYKRETMGNTFLEGGIAIPHGESQYVTKPTISITKLANPVLWENNQYVDLIFLLALTEDNSKEIEDLYTILYTESVLDSLKSADSVEQIYTILTDITL